MEFALEPSSDVPIFDTPSIPPPTNPSIATALEKLAAGDVALTQAMGSVQNKPKKVSRSHRLTRSYLRVELINDLAAGELSQEKLAEKYRVSPATITDFKRRFSYEIEERARFIREQVGDVTSGLWIADKRNRLASYQEQADILEEAIIKRDGQGNKPDVSLMKQLSNTLRSVAEELGDLPSRVQINNTQAESVHYTIEGVDTDKL